MRRGTRRHEGVYSRPTSIGILGDYTQSGGKLAREPARLCGKRLTIVWLKEHPRALLKLALEPSAAVG